MRTLVPAGAVVTLLGGAVVLFLSLAATVASAPSALAAVTAAAAKTSAVSFRVTSTLTYVESPASDGSYPPFRITGVFDPGRGLGEEEARNRMLHIRIVDERVYVELAGPEFAIRREKLYHGKLWLESLLPPERDTSFEPRPGFQR